MFHFCAPPYIFKNGNPAKLAQLHCHTWALPNSIDERKSKGDTKRNITCASVRDIRQEVDFFAPLFYQTLALLVIGQLISKCIFLIRKTRHVALKSS